MLDVILPEDGLSMLNPLNVQPSQAIDAMEKLTSPIKAQQPANDVLCSIPIADTNLALVSKLNVIVNTMTQP